MAGSTLKGEPVPCQSGGCTHFPREGVRVNTREDSVEHWPGPYRARITDTSAPPGRNAYSPCGRREREERRRRRRRRKQADTHRGSNKWKKRVSEGKWVTEWKGGRQREPSLGEGVSLSIHTQTKTRQSQHSTHSHWVESTAGRAHRKTNNALDCLNTILTVQLWLSLPQFSHTFKAMCACHWRQLGGDQKRSDVVTRYKGVTLEVVSETKCLTCYMCVCVLISTCHRCLFRPQCMLQLSWLHGLFPPEQMIKYLVNPQLLSCIIFLQPLSEWKCFFLESLKG